MDQWLEEIRAGRHCRAGRISAGTDEKTRHFRVGGPADLYVCPKKQELPVILGLAKKKGLAVTVIGNGSNLLVGDKGIRGLVIEVGGTDECGGSAGKYPACAGRCPAFPGGCKKAAAAGLGGMEFAAGIPGSMGGAVTMNAGAYGGEMKDVIRQVTVLTQECEQKGTHGGTGSVLPAQLYSQESFSGTGGRVVPDAGTGAGDPCKDGRTQGKRVEKQPLEYPCRQYV